MSVDKDELKDAVETAIAATDKGDYTGALKIFKVVYAEEDFKAPPDGLSHYGLCAAIVDNQTPEGIEFCKRARRMQSSNPTHFVNLVRIHLEKGDRNEAAEALQLGLSKLPNDRILTKFGAEMGLKQKTSNQRKEVSSGDTGQFREMLSNPMVMALIGFLAFALIFGVTFAMLYKQAYGG